VVGRGKILVSLATADLRRTLRTPMNERDDALTSLADACLVPMAEPEAPSRMPTAARLFGLYR